jgi:tetratricopeptide (TPR) repeat protein
MPATTFMGVDKRNDHSFRIPRPTLSADIGTPNACNQCHKDKTPQWSATHLNRWLGQSQEISHAYANIFFANQSGQLGSQRLLLKLAIDKTQPAIVRATALSNISGEVNQNSFMVVQQGLLSEDELIRQGALDALRAFPLRHRILAFPLVWDDTRSVRIQAARLLAGYPMPEKVTDAQKRKLQDVIDEYIESQTFNAERPEAQVNLGDIYADLGVGLSTSPDTAPGAEKTTSLAANERYTKKSEAAFRKAIQLQASYIPAYINFSQSLTNRGKEEQAKQILSAGIKHNPDSAILYHALGLSQVRQKNIDAAVISLARAANLAPDNRRYAYVYAIAVHSTGNKDLAIKKLGAIHQQYPDDVDILYTLVNYNRDAGRNDLALKYARKLGALMPDNAQINELINTLNSSDDLKRPVPPYQEAP